MRLLKAARTFYQLSRNHGIVFTLNHLYQSFVYYNIQYKQAFVKNFTNKKGIEIGGPSKMFSRHLPIYKVIHSLDGVNFSSNTIWEGQLSEGDHFIYDKGKKGHQYILDAVELNTIEDNKYDFCLSCNNLEHIANPIKSLKEWKRILKEDGLLLLVLPNKIRNFDRNRAYTTLAHIIKDYEENTGEDDMTHFNEVLTLHDTSLDIGINSFSEFKNRLQNNYQYRSMHHHVFDAALIKDMLQYAGFEMLIAESNPKDHIILAKKIR